MSNTTRWIARGARQEQEEYLRELLRAGWGGKFDSDTRRALEMFIDALGWGFAEGTGKKELARWLECLARLIREEP